MMKCLNKHYGQRKKACDQTLDVAVDLCEVAEMNEADSQQIQVESSENLAKFSKTDDH